MIVAFPGYLHLHFCMWLLIGVYVFLISPSFIASEGLWFVSVSFPGILIFTYGFVTYRSDFGW